MYSSSVLYAWQHFPTGVKKLGLVILILVFVLWQRLPQPQKLRENFGFENRQSFFLTNSLASPRVAQVTRPYQ